MLDQAYELRKRFEDSRSKKSTKLITITSGKGGVGKSNFVVNLAIILSKKGHKVLIFDADIGMGNDDVLMGVFPKNSVLDLIKNNLEINDVIVKGPEGVDLLPGGSGMNYIEDITDSERHIFLEKISNLDGYDYILIDTGAGISRSILAFIAASQKVILTTTPEPTAITDGYSLLKAIDHFKLKEEVYIVVNKATDDEEGNLAYIKYTNTISRFLKIKPRYFGCIIDDRKLVASVKQQIPVVLNYPSCNASNSIKKIADRIIHDSEVYEEEEVSAIGFFKKIFDIFS